MATRKGYLPGGLAFPQHCQAGKLAAVGAGATDSSYTEAGAGPGLPINSDAWSGLRVEVSNAQAADFSARCIKPGMPARDGLQLAYKLDSEAATHWRGWNGPQLLTGFLPLDWGNVATNAYALTTVPSSQKVVMAYADNGTGDLAVLVIDVTDETATIASDTATIGADWNYPAVVCLPGSERLLFFYGNNAHYSDDLGETIEPLARNIIAESISTFDTYEVCYYRGDLLMLVSKTGGTDFDHYISTDGGATFKFLKTYSSLGSSLRMTANADGIHVLWYDNSATDCVYRRLGTVFEELDAKTATVVASGTTYARCALCADEMGTLYALTGADQQWIYESRDNGENWTVYACPTIEQGSNVDTVIYTRLTWAMGRAVLAFQFSDNAVVAANDVGCMLLGGWSNVVASVDDGQSGLAQNRWGYGTRTGSTSANGACWFPWHSPSAAGSYPTAAGTVAATIANGEMQINSVAQYRYYQAALSTSEAALLAYFRVKVVSGGASGSCDAGAVLILSDNATYRYDVEIRLTTTGAHIYDNSGAASLASPSHDFTAWSDIIAYMDLGTLTVAFRTAGASVWTVVYDSTIATSGTAATGFIRFGNVATGTADSRWRLAGFACSQAKPPVLRTAIAEMEGRAFNARPQAIPDLSDSAGNVCRLAAVSGPSRIADGVSVPAWFDYALQRAHCEISPSPAETWRSTDLSEQTIVYDLEAQQFIGKSIVLFVANANFATCYLEHYNGSTWVTDATLNLYDGFSGLTYTVSGNTLYPNTATTNAGGRWIWENEARRGWIRATTGGGAVAASRIVEHTAGGWTSETTSIPVFDLENGTAITALGSSTTCRVVWPTGLIVFHPSTMSAATARYWRVRIPSGTAGEDTPSAAETYYEAGIIAVCRLQAFGDSVHWGRSIESNPNVETTVNGFGTIRARQRGPNARRWAFGWPNETNHLQLRIGAAGDYVGPSSGLPNAGAEDVYNLLRGLLATIDGGALPVVAIEQIPNTSGTIITDPMRYLYARLSSGVRANQTAGDDLGVDEVLRVEPLTLNELV